MKEKKLGEIRFVEDKDKAEWYKFDNHLCEAVFERRGGENGF